MAVSFTHSPNNYDSVNNKVHIVAYDTTALADPTYKYIATLYAVYGGTLIQISTQTVAPYPNQGHGLFDFTRQCKSKITPAFKSLIFSNSQFTMAGGELYQAFSVEIRKETAGVVSAVLLTKAFIVANDYTTDFVNKRNKLAGISTYQIASNRDLKELVVSSKANFFLLPIINMGGVSDFELTIAATTSTVNIPTKTVRHANVAPSYFANPSSKTELAIKHVNDNQVFVRYSYDVACDHYNNHYVVHFLNSFGVFESVLFSKPAKKMISKKQKGIEISETTLNAAGIVTPYYDTRVFRGNNKTYASEYEEKLILKTDFISDANYIWLKELVVSPIIYLTINNSAEVMPLSIMANDYEEKTYTTNKLSQLTIEFSVNKTFNVQ